MSVFWWHVHAVCWGVLAFAVFVAAPIYHPPALWFCLPSAYLCGLCRGNAMSQRCHEAATNDDRASGGDA